MGGHIRGRVWHRFLSRRASGEPGTSPGEPGKSPGESRPPSQYLALLVPPAHHTLERSRARITEQPCWISFQIPEQTQTINDSRQMCGNLLALRCVLNSTMNLSSILRWAGPQETCASGWRYSRVGHA